MELTTVQAYANLIADAKGRGDDQTVAVLTPYYEAELRRAEFGFPRDAWEANSGINRVTFVSEYDRRFERAIAVADRIAAVIIPTLAILGAVVCPIMVGLM